MKTFLICPVRGHDPDTWLAVVKNLEADGYEVHFPPRDTDQRDTTGLKICVQNRAAIAAADVVHVVWDGMSQGCLFDLGMAFAMEKMLVLVQVPPVTKGVKSFQSMMHAWQETSR